MEIRRRAETGPQRALAVFPGMGARPAEFFRHQAGERLQFQYPKDGWTVSREEKE
jgi:hypothetical protein